MHALQIVLSKCLEKKKEIILLQWHIKLSVITTDCRVKCWLLPGPTSQLLQIVQDSTFLIKPNYFCHFGNIASAVYVLLEKYQYSNAANYLKMCLDYMSRAFVTDKMVQFVFKISIKCKMF